MSRSTPDVELREVAAAEAPTIASELARLHAEAIESGMALGWFGPVDALEDTWRRAVETLRADERRLVVAESDGRVIGMAQLAFSGAANAPHRGEIQRVAVAESDRGTGVGRALMSRVEQLARENGVTLVWLTTHADTAACAFYEELGYSRLGTMPNFSRRPDGTLWPGAFYFREL